jgi:tetratricopeptide (TPR) repeat protein
MDLKRYLADQPVEARPSSASYRLRKFFRRNKGPVLAASIVLLALVGGIIGTTVGMIQADHRRIEADQARAAEAGQRTKAEKARDRTRQALDAMTSSFTEDSLSTQQAISDDQKRFLSEVLSYYQEFAGEKAGDEPSRARTAQAAQRVGTIEYRLGRRTDAEAAFRLARDEYEKLVADVPAVPVYRQRLSNSHNNLGLLLASLGRRPEAEQNHRQALAIGERLSAEFPAVPEYRQELARSRSDLADKWCQFIFLSDNDIDTNSDQRRGAAVQARDKPRKQMEKKRPVSLAAEQGSDRPDKPLRSVCAAEP